MGDIQEIETVGGLNRNITSGDVQETVLVQEAMQERKNCRNCTDDCFQTGNQIRIDCGDRRLPERLHFHTDCLYSFVQMECVLIRSQ
mgnify:CR=1 FL=1